MSHSFFQLEPRLLFDASAADTADHVHDDGAHTLFPGLAFVQEDARIDTGHAAETADRAGLDATGESAARVEIFVIDASVREPAEIENALPADSVVIRLDAGTDGIATLSEALAGYSQIDALHIFSHGVDGEVRLGASILDGEALAAHGEQIAGWGSSFSAGGDILLYGCDVAKSATGLSFVTRLAELTGTDVAASTDPTGSVDKGGNWDLEFVHGTLETRGIVAGGYADLLDAPHITGVEGLIRMGVEDTDMLVQWARIDSSAETINMVIKTDSAHGILHLQTVEGLTFEDGYENGKAELRFSGTRSDINMALLGHTNDSGGGNENSMIYRPAADFNGRATLTITATADGQESSKTFQLEFSPVNDAPDLSTQIPATVAEGGTVAFSLSQLATDANALDPDIATGQQVPEQLMVVVDSLPAQGKLTYKGGVVAVGAVVPVTDLAQLKYTHNGTDLTANITDSFAVRVNDGGGGTTTGQISITVTPKNVAPSIGGEPIHILEGQVKAVAPTINLGDQADTLATSTIVIDNIVTGSQGTFFFDANGDNVIDAGEELSGSVTLSATQAADIATGLKFFHNGAEPNAPGAVAPSFRITVTDSGGGLGDSAKLTTAQTVALEVEPVNDDPVMDTNIAPTAGQAVEVDERSTTVLTTAMLKVTDVDRDPTNVANTTPPAQLVYTVTSALTQGELRLQTGVGYAVLGVGGRFTQDDIDNGRVTYVQTAEIPDGSNVADKFAFTVRDSAFGFDMSDPANPGLIREGAIRDAGGAIKTHEFHFSIKPEPAVDPGHGPVEPEISYDITNSGASTNTPTQWNEDNVGATDGRYLLTDQMLNYSIKRTNNNGTPGDTSDDYTETLDPKEIVYTLTTDPGNGTLYQKVGDTWVPMVPGSVFTQADINAGRVSFVSDGSEMHSSSFAFKVSDGTEAGTQSGTFNIALEPTNDRPVATGGETRVPEGEGNIVRLGSSVIGMSDVDTHPATDALWFQINGLPAKGTLQRWDGSAWVAVQTGEWLSQDILTAAVDGGTSGLRYVHDGSEPLAYAGGPKVTFTYTVRDDLAAPALADRFSVNTSDVAATMDGGGPAQSHQSATGTAAVNILPVNNPPLVADKPGDPDPTISGTIENGGELQGKNKVLANVPEGGWVAITKDHLTTIDPDNTTVQRQYRITQAPALGWLFLDDKALNVGSTFTQKDIDEGRIHYWQGGKELEAPVTDSLGTYNDKFHFIVSDGVQEDRGDATHNNVFLITFSDPENDIPELTASQTKLDVFSGSDTYVNVPEITVVDADLDAITAGEKDFLRAEISVVDTGNALVAGAKLKYTAADPSDPASGGVYLSGKETNALVVQGTRAEVQAILNSLQVAMTEDRDSATDKIRVVVDDRLHDSSGNLVLVDGQGVANGGKVNEVPRNGNPALATVNADNNRVIVDISLRSSIENDAPSITNTTVFKVNEDTALTLSGFTLADVDSFDQPVTVTVELFNDAAYTTKVNVLTEGKLIVPTPGALPGVSDSGNNSNTVTLTGKMADVQNALNKLKFQGATDYNGPDQGNGTLYLRTTFEDFPHGGGAVNQSAKIEQTITIVPVNDVPTLTVPDNKILADNTFIALSGFAVSDTKDTAQGATDFITVTLTAKDGDDLYGKLKINTPGAATVTDNDTSTVKVSGTAADVQAALNSLVYTPGNANVDKIITITATADDRVPAETGQGNGAEGVGVDGNNTVSKSFTITISNINDVPTVTNPATATMLEDTSLVFDGGGAGHAPKIEFKDSDTFGSTNNTVTISVPVGKVSVDLSGTTKVDGANNSNTITLRGSLANINAALATLKYTPDADYNSTNPVKLTATYNDKGNVGSGGEQEVTATVDITVTPVNDAPVRTDANPVVLSVNEDDGAPAGDTVESLFGGKFNDDKDKVEGGSSAHDFAGIAITTNNAIAAQGLWQYSSDNGDTWTDLPTVSANSALLLNATDKLRFVPAPDFHGTPGELTARLVDSSGGAITTGDIVDVSNDTTKSGGITRYSNSANAVTLNTSVTSVNDRPTATDVTLAGTTEDNANPSGHVISSLDFGFADVTDNQSSIPGGGNTATNFGGIAIVNNAANPISEGVWQYNTGSGWVDIGSADLAPSDSSAIILPTTAQLRFLPAENYNGTPGGLSVRVADTVQTAGTEQDITGNLGQTSTWSEVVTLGTSVTPENDAPTLTHTASNSTFTEDGNTGQNTAIAVKLLNPGDVFDLDLNTTPGLDNAIFGQGTITVRLTDGIAGDVLEHGTLPSGVTSAGGSGATALVITLDNDTTLDEVKAILESIQYKNTSDNPTNYGVNPIRTYSIVLNDGNNAQAGGNAGGPDALDAAEITGTITIDPINDPPMATDNVNSVTEDADPNTAIGNVRTDGTPDSDPDNTLDELTVTGIRIGLESAGGTVTGIAPGSTSASGFTEITGLYGTLKIGADGSYLYELDNGNPAVNALKDGETLTEHFTYTLSDPDGLTDTAQLVITINGKTDGVPSITPVDGNEGAAGHADVYESGLTIDDPDAKPSETTGQIDWSAFDGLKDITIAGQTFTVAQLKAFSVDSPSGPIPTANGELRLTGLSELSGAATAPTGGKLGYIYTLKTPLDNGVLETEGTDNIALSLRDPHDDEGTGTLTIRIVDDVPTARDDSGQMRKYDPNVAGNVTTNDRMGADGPAASGAVTGVQVGDSGGVDVSGNVGVAVPGSYGALTLNADGTYSYALDTFNAEVSALQYGQSLTETFTYTITDKDGDTSTAQLVITINGSDVPKAVNDTYSTHPGGTVRGNLAGNDTPSLDGGNVWSVATGPAHGTVVVNPDGTFTYTASSGYSGSDSFTYTITDADGDTSTATVFIGIDDSPGASNDNFSTPYNTPVSGNLASNDRPSLDGGNVWTVATGPAHGTVVVNPDGTFTYTPTPGFTGSDSFTYTITDRDGDKSTATVSITVGENHKPVAVPDAVSTTPNTPVSGNLAGNDTPSLDGDNVWTVATGPVHGTVVVNPDGTFTYTPTPGYVGSDSFTYTITDKDGDTSTATVSITVSENHKPVAVPDTVSTKADTPVSGNLAGNDTPSLDGGNVWTVATGPAHGTVVVNPDGTFTYTPAPGFTGSDSFTYTITDKDGDTSTATVSITVGENHKPVAVPDTVSTEPDTPISGSLAGNDTPSLDGGNVWTVTTGPAHGSVVVNPDGTFTYTPTPGFTGSDSFTYTITDKDGDTSTATVSITVGVPGGGMGGGDDGDYDHHGGEKPGVSPLPTRPSAPRPGAPDFGGTSDPFSPDGGGGTRLPLTVTSVFQPRMTEEQRIMARALELSEFPRRLEIAYVQWIDLRFGQERTTVDLPPQALSVLTGTEIRSEAKLADGSPLPFWIVFEPDARALRVTPPENLREKNVTVKIWLWDEKGNEAVVTIALNLDDKTSHAGAGRNYSWETEQTVVARPGEEVSVSLLLKAQHTEVLTGERLSISATLADGSPLPKGLKLNPATGEVSGKVLGAARETVLEVRVIITDEHGARSEVIHHVHVVPGEEQAFTPPQGRASFTAQLAACLLV